MRILYAAVSLTLVSLVTAASAIVADDVAAAATVPAEAAVVSVDQTGPTVESGAAVATPATRPSRRARAIRLIQPYSLIGESLSEEQKQQIAAIHAEIVEKKKILDEEEAERCAAILSDAQKVAMQDAVDQRKADQKARNAAPAN